MKYSLTIILLFMIFKLFGQNSKENKFWDWFVKNESVYYLELGNREIEEELFDEFADQLKRVSDELVFEFSPTYKDGLRELMISAEGIEEFFPIAKKLLDEAPDLKRWKFSFLRQRVPVDDIQVIIGDVNIKYSDIFFRYGKDGDKIGVELNIKGFDGENTIKNAIYILLDGLLGEYDVTTQIGWIEWLKLDEAKMDNLYPLVELRDIIDRNKELVE